MSELLSLTLITKKTTPKYEVGFMVLMRVTGN